MYVCMYNVYILKVNESTSEWLSMNFDWFDYFVTQILKLGPNSDIRNMYVCCVYVTYSTGLVIIIYHFVANFD